MKLRIHYMDGEHTDIEFGADPGQAYSWRPTDRTLVVQDAASRNRAHYPWSSVRFFEVLIDDEVLS